MFYNFVKSKLEMGAVDIRPPARGPGEKAKIKATGITAIAAMFLSLEEKEKLVTLSKYISMRRVRVSYYDTDY